MDKCQRFPYPGQGFEPSSSQTWVPNWNRREVETSAYCPFKFYMKLKSRTIVFVDEYAPFDCEYQIGRKQTLRPVRINRNSLFARTIRFWLEHFDWFHTKMLWAAKYVVWISVQPQNSNATHFFFKTNWNIWKRTFLSYFFPWISPDVKDSIS